MLQQGKYVNLIEKTKQRILAMDSKSLAEFRENVIKYSVAGNTRTAIIEMCDSRLDELDRSKVMVDNGELDDIDG